MAKKLTTLAIFLLMLMTGIVMAAGKQHVIAIVVGSQENVTELKLSANNLNLIYWRKQLFWPRGLRIKPVNLMSQNQLRIQFSQTVLGSRPKAQIDYWNGQYFNGILPPHPAGSEEAVLRYIVKTKGGVGYVNACNVDNRVIPLLWIKNGKLTSIAPYLSCP
jgi:hypothetical protein